MSRRATLFLLFILLPFRLLEAEEGMYPINEIHKLNLRAKGLLLDPKDIYNPSGTGLIDAIVKIGGCTGSFVSPDGLIITNHHCVFGYVQAASTKERDYITDGFLAATRSDEMPARGGTVRITESVRDVTGEVMSAVSDTMEAAARSKAIDARIRTLAAAAEKENPGKRADVSEMLPGKSYLLFLSVVLRDIRVVYVPPRSIGEFGGENDNWVWPRHTGDFSFVRAYVAPDGSPADFAPGNVPYHPRKFLKVQPAGVGEEDAVFILGYPGRTYRHRTSHYLAYEENMRMPYVADLYEWQIATMESLGASDRAIALKYDAKIKSLANASKNYRGKLKGMARLHTVEKKKGEEELLQSFIDGSPALARKYGTVLRDIGKVYDEMNVTALRELTLDNLRSASGLLAFAFAIHDAGEEMTLHGNLSDTSYVQRTVGRLRDQAAAMLRDLYVPGDRVLLRELLVRAAKLPAGQRIDALDHIVGGQDFSGKIDKFLDAAYDRTKLSDSTRVQELLDRAPESLREADDPFVELASSLAPLYKELRGVRQIRENRLSKLSADLIEVKQEYMKKEFIPDANSTLRFTSGRVRGYSPADATYYQPITSLRGVMEKTTGVDPFRSPKKLMELYHAKHFGRFALPQLGTVPVDLLYDLDTTGGNSGSPLLNAKGELVGVNFDRAFEATINDYAWSSDYSRSIGVDIRYVLWVTLEVGGAPHLLREMGVMTD